jgi:hypothetical protein
MGRQSSSKSRVPPPPTPPPGKRSNFSIFAAVAVVLAVAAGFVLMRGRGTPASPDTTASNQSQTAEKTSIADVHPTADDEAAAAAAAKLGPHTQATLPPVPFRGYAPPRPPEVVEAAFRFAAEHPEIASYIPCFCGCQHMGHRGNEQCFVRSRAANGDVVEWEEHGVDCAVCIDVATKSRQMYAAGASARDIRTAIEKEYVPVSTTMTPTPKPPTKAPSTN